MFYTCLEFHGLGHNADRGKYSIKLFDLSTDALNLYYHYYKSMVGHIEILMMSLPASYGILRVKSGIRREITPMIHYYYGHVLDYYKEFS